MLLEQNYPRHAGLESAMAVADEALEKGGRPPGGFAPLLGYQDSDRYGLRPLDFGSEERASSVRLSDSWRRRLPGGAGGRDYPDQKVFKKTGISVRYQDFHNPVYPQRGGSQGVSCRTSSVFDLVCNCPDESRRILVLGSPHVKTLT